MHVLIITDDVVGALKTEQKLGAGHAVRRAGSLEEALAMLRSGDPWPDIIVSDLKPNDVDGYRSLARIRIAAPRTPLLVGTETAASILSVARADERPLVETEDVVEILKMMVKQHQSLNLSLAAEKRQIVGEIEQLVASTAERAVERGIDELKRRIGVEDIEGVQMAIRFARGWEAAKHRFMQAIATGIASAFLVALGAGLVAMFKTAQTAK